jgi:Trypsin-like peptidase domain
MVARSFGSGAARIIASRALVCGLSVTSTLVLVVGLGQVVVPTPGAVARGAVILVETKGNVPPPSLPVLPELHRGSPIDFQFAALRKFGPPADEAVKKLETYYEEAAKKKTESVVRDDLRTHPALYAGPEAILEDERVPVAWHSLLNDRRSLIKHVLRSVGRIQLYNLDDPPGLPVHSYSEGEIVGTGFMAGEGIVMTNRHVANFFAELDQPGWPFRKDGRAGLDAVVRINFAGVYDDEPQLFRITKVLFAEPDERRDVVLLKVEPKPNAPLPEPLALQTIDPKAADTIRKVFVCGYPTSNNEDDPRVENLFKILRVKRVSLGEMTGSVYEKGLLRIYHNCFTIGGSSGSPLVDFDSGTVWGLHYFGNADNKGNRGEPMWEITMIPGLRTCLGRAATDPPQSVLPPLPVLEPIVFVNQLVRPSLRVCQGKVVDKIPGLWSERVSLAEQHLRRVIPSVGLIVGTTDWSPNLESPIGTGFLIAPGIVITARHIALAFADINLEFKQHPETKRPFTVKMDFARESCPTTPQTFRVERVLAIIPGPGPDVAVLRLEKPDSNREFPPPIQIQKREPSRLEAGESIFVIGHPFDDPRTPYEVINAVFGLINGTKRFSPGLLTGIRTDDLEHDCSTLGGDAGAPMVSFSTGKVLGVHWGGSYLKANDGTPIWKALADPALRKIPEIQRLLDSKDKE